MIIHYPRMKMPYSNFSLADQNPAHPLLKKPDLEKQKWLGSWKNSNPKGISASLEMAEAPDIQQHESKQLFCWLIMSQRKQVTFDSKGTTGTTTEIAEPLSDLQIRGRKHRKTDRIRSELFPLHSTGMILKSPRFLYIPLPLLPKTTFDPFGKG